MGQIPIIGAPKPPVRMTLEQLEASTVDPVEREVLRMAQAAMADVNALVAASTIPPLGMALAQAVSVLLQVAQRVGPHGPALLTDILVPIRRGVREATRRVRARGQLRLSAPAQVEAQEPSDAGSPTPATA